MNETMHSSFLAPPSPTSSERLAVALAHAGALVAFFLAPLLVYLLKRGDSRYVEFQSLQALLWSVAGALVSLATCGLAIPVFMVWHVIAAVKTLDGREYEYPVVGKIARDLMTG